MAFVSTTIISLLCILCISRLHKFSSEIVPDSNSFQTYLVHVEVPDDVISESEDLERWYRSFLPPATTGEEEGSLVYSYHHVMKGFVARLTPDQVKDMEKNERFIAAWPEEILSIATTHSPNFLGLNRDQGFWNDSEYGKGVIIGVIDLGFFLDHSSFSDEGMSPPPSTWKGYCDSNITSCNKKLIGAKYFGQKTPNHNNKHGTHIASTAAGNFVAGANSFQQASGTAAGIAPGAHLAIYRASSSGDVLAAMEAAINDGVDVLSLSIGQVQPNFAEDPIAIGAYRAMTKGIFVSCAAGNNGPSPRSLMNDAPWILTVGASTINRKLCVVAVVGNGEVIAGEAIYIPSDFPETPLPLIYTRKEFSKGRGKIVACDVITKKSISTIIKEAQKARVRALVLINNESEGATNVLLALDFPTIQVSYAGGVRIKQYTSLMGENATARLSFKRTVIGDDCAPLVDKCPAPIDQGLVFNWNVALSSFNETSVKEDIAPTVGYLSSRGPSVQSPGILKPDILGPGVNILAASPQGRNSFAFDSGTSMACPHLSGVAALLKRVHPDWSPAAIKSAIMTTADVVNRAGNWIEDQRLMPADLFATGAGHVNPAKASDPGLVYDLEALDYIPYLCGLNFSDKQVGRITNENVKCSRVSSIPQSQLNYPSFSILFGSGVQTYTRTVTNMGERKSSYVVNVSLPDGVDVDVKPKRLDFTQERQKLTYNVTFRLPPNGESFNYSQGFLTWSSTRYEVRSPIVAINMTGKT